MKRGTGVTLRNDLVTLVEEIKFEDLNLAAEAIVPLQFSYPKKLDVTLFWIENHV